MLPYQQEHFDNKNTKNVEASVISMYTFSSRFPTEIYEYFYENIHSMSLWPPIKLRRSAANDKIFKLFFLHPFLASTIYNKIIKNKFDKG